MKKKLVRITTVPISLKVLLEGQLDYMGQYYDVLAVSSPGQELNHIVQGQSTVKTYAIMMTRQITPIHDVVALIKIYRLLKKTKPEIIHTHTPKAGLLGMVAGFCARVPIRVHTVAGLPLLESRGIKREILNIVERITSYCAHRVYPNSFRLLEIMVENKLCNREKLKVIGNGSSNGIDISYFNKSKLKVENITTLRLELTIKEEEFIYCFIGRIVKSKGVEELVYAFLDIYEIDKTVKLLIVGDFEQELDPVSDDVHHLILEHAGIIYVGYQNDVRPFLAISNVFVFPSYREGFPNVVMQAGAMDLPCIVSNINGCNEIIKDNFNGLVVEAKDKYSLRKAMLTLLTEEDKLNAMARNSRESISCRFDRGLFWHYLKEEYEALENQYL